LRANVLHINCVAGERSLRSVSVTCARHVGISEFMTSKSFGPMSTDIVFPQIPDQHDIVVENVSVLHGLTAPSI
jgi:hypothetical protein